MANLPRTLLETYDRILRKKNAEDFWLVKKTLELVAFSQPSLTIAQICKILSERNTAINEDKVLELCSSLITKSEDGLYFEFAHGSVREYLLEFVFKNRPLSGSSPAQVKE